MCVRVCGGTMSIDEFNLTLSTHCVGIGDGPGIFDIGCATDAVTMAKETRSIRKLFSVQKQSIVFVIKAECRCISVDANAFECNGGECSVSIHIEDQ